MYVLSYIYLASVYKMALLSSSAAMEKTQKTEQPNEDPILDLAISYALIIIFKDRKRAVRKRAQTFKI